MKRSIFAGLVFVTLIGTAFAQAPAGGQGRGGRPNIFAPAATASGPVADAVNAMLTAFNNHDTAFLKKLVAPDAVWLDEDGHHLIAQVWVDRLMAANPQKKLTIMNLRTSDWGTGGWAAFNYVMEGGNEVKGTDSLVFKKNGNDWQIVLVHGAVDTKIGAH
jgi:ketosteroid isomerase-like protein